MQDRAQITAAASAAAAAGSEPVLSVRSAAAGAGQVHPLGREPRCRRLLAMSLYCRTIHLLAG